MLPWQMATKRNFENTTFDNSFFLCLLDLVFPHNINDEWKYPYQHVFKVSYSRNNACLLQCSQALRGYTHVHNNIPVFTLHWMSWSDLTRLRIEKCNKVVFYFSVICINLQLFFMLLNIVMMISLLMQSGLTGFCFVCFF